MTISKYITHEMMTLTFPFPIKFKSTYIRNCMIMTHKIHYIILG